MVPRAHDRFWLAFSSVMLATLQPCNAFFVIVKAKAATKDSHLHSEEDNFSDRIPKLVTNEILSAPAPTPIKKSHLKGDKH
jgi:hypothetical protein